MVGAGIGDGKGWGDLGGGGGGGSSDLVAIPAGDTSLRGNIENQKQFSTPAVGLSFLAAWA